MANAAGGARGHIHQPRNGPGPCWEAGRKRKTVARNIPATDLHRWWNRVGRGSRGAGCWLLVVVVVAWLSLGRRAHARRVGIRRRLTLVGMHCTFSLASPPPPPPPLPPHSSRHQPPALHRSSGLTHHHHHHPLDPLAPPSRARCRCRCRYAVAAAAAAAARMPTPAH
ncbi:hypothetical protein IWX47DRAFT_48444 [Phyllosticta citricarpa]